jgi:YVTN family beta-propeller protein
VAVIAASLLSLRPESLLASPIRLPTGQYLTPTAAPGSRMQRLQTGLRADGGADADGAVATAISPDGTALLVLTTGYDTSYFTQTGSPIVHHVLDPLTAAVSKVTTPAAQWIFVYDIRAGWPRLVHLVSVPFSYNGIAWDPLGRRFFVSGGPDDRIYIFAAAHAPSVSADQTWVPDAPFIELGHNSKPQLPLSTQDGGLLKGSPAGGARAQAQGLPFPAVAAGIALSGNGKTLYVANLQNDSMSVVDVARRRVTKEVHFFRPGGRLARGEYPFWIVVKSDSHGAAAKVYASSLRDGEIVVTQTGGEHYVQVGGEPNKMVLAPDGQTLYVANGDLDAIDVLDTRSDRLVRTISLQRPGFHYFGANPNSLALDSQGNRLYVTLGGENALAVIDLRTGTVVGRIPTGWYPSGVSVNPNARMIYVVNTKSPSGPTAYKIDVSDNPFPLAHGVNGYVFNLEKAGLLSFAIPRAAELAKLSAIVDANNGFTSQGRPPTTDIMAFLRGKIKHVIYIMKENRTYDQVLGDLRPGNGDPHLVQFGQLLTPNNHALASQFVTLDNFYASGDVSGDGWSWTLQGRANDYNAKTVAFDYGNGGFTTEWQGEPRDINMSLPVFGSPTPYGERITTLFDPSGGSTILPGTKDVAATQGAGDLDRAASGGFIWDAALRAGLTHRHYGIYTSILFYDPKAPYYLPISRTPFASKIVQAVPVQPELWGRTDMYYRGWDLDVPDQYRFEEWKREFDGYVKRGDLPNFEVVDLPTDHFGNFRTNVGGLDTPESQIAGNDYALGELVETVSHSPYWKDTAIFVVEDDAQDGPDHVDSHRTVAHVISAYTKRHAVISTFYTTVSMLRTIEDILGIDHLGMFDANAAPMSDVFTRQPDQQPYSAIVPGILCKPPVKATLIPACANPRAKKTQALSPLHGGAWWARMTNGFNFRQPDAIDSDAFNRILWAGTKGSVVVYPDER